MTPKLTKTERVIVPLLSRWRGYPTESAHLGMAPSTLRQHVNRMKGKLPDLEQGIRYDVLPALAACRLYFAEHQKAA